MTKIQLIVCVELVHVQVMISLSSSISLQLFDLLQENEAWKPTVVDRSDNSAFTKYEVESGGNPATK